MGQKIIPISLRLNKTKNWNSQWTIEKKEYANLLFFDLEVRKYFTSLFNYKFLKLIQFKIVKTSKNINIYIYFTKNIKFTELFLFNNIINNLNLFYKNHNIKLFIRRIKLRNLLHSKKKFKKIFYKVKKNNRITNHIKKILYNINYALYTKNINIISNHIQQTLQRKKRHKKPIQNFDKMLQIFYKMFSNFLGYRLQFKGRLNGIKRKRKMLYQKGKIPLNSLNCDIKYHFTEFKTPSGICSIKFWIFLKKN